tara:strand:- start:3583 stop:4356 length:774 start_codon:yes stop_codon:yes gene_type:complete
MKETVDKYYLVDTEINELSRQLAEKKQQRAKLDLQLYDKTHCKICNKQFTSWKYYYKHCMTVHKTKYECGICRLKFNTLEERCQHDTDGCRCNKWYITKVTNEIKQCTKQFFKTTDKTNHNCGGFKTKEKAEQALEFRNKNRVKSMSESSSDSVNTSMENITIDIIKKPEPKKVSEPKKVTKEMLIELQEEGKIYNGSRQWNDVLKPFIDDYLEPSELLIYYDGRIYGDCYVIEDFDEELSPIEFVIYNDEFIKFED